MNTHTEKILNIFPELKKIGEMIPPDIEFQSFVNNFFGMLPAFYQNLTDMELATCLQTAYHVVRYCANDYKDYYVMPYLSSCLEQTSLKADPRMFHAPFNEFIIEPPEGFGQIYNDITGMHNIELFYISSENHPDHKLLKILAVGKPNKNSTNPYDDALFFFKCPIYLDKSIEESFENAHKYMEEEARKEIDGGHNLQETKRIFKYCINVILYATSINADKQWKNVYPPALEAKLSRLHDEHRKNKLKKMNQNKMRKKCILGGGFIKPKISVFTDGKKTTEIKITKRFLVEPHYQGYWVGSGTEKRLVPMWKEAYWKGPEMADLVHENKIQDNPKI